MSRVSSRLSFVGHRSLVAIQTFLLIATLFAPIPVAAEDPTDDPGASAPPTTEPAATPDPTPDPTAEPTAEPTPDPTPEPPAATPDPTPEPTAEPPTAEPPTAEPPTAEPPAATPDPTTEPSTSVGTPTIQSDLADYPPGGLVTLTGSGWQPGESVHIFVNDDWGSSWSRNVDVIADASGAIVDQFNLPNWFVAVYSVTATGSISGAATTSFTDARVVTTATLNGGTTVTVNTGGSISAVVNVTTDGSGANARWRSTSWSIATTDPAGTSAGTCVNHGNHDLAGSYSESFSITAPPTAGTYNAYFKAHADDGCGIANGPSALFKLTDGVIARWPTTTMLSSSGSPSVFGTLVTFTATVTATGGNPSGVGTVNFSAGSGPLCTAVALSGNTATCSTSTLTVTGSPHTITAQYNGTTTGSPQFAPSALATLSGGQTITKASSTTTVTCPAGPYTYTGLAQTPCTATVTGAGGLSLSPTPDYTANTNAGTATASYTYGGDDNHTGSDDSDSFTIDKATLAVDADDQTKVFADDDPTFSWTYSGFVNGETADDVTISGAADCSRDPGETVLGGPYAITCAPGDLLADNYTFVTGEPGALTITKASSTTTVTCPAGPYTYTGLAQTPCTATVTGAGGLSLSPTPDYTANTNAGTATASYTYGGDDNHTGSDDSDSFTIDKADAVCTVTGYDVVYDAAAHTATGSCVGVEDETLAGLDLSTTTHTNAGTYADDPWSFIDLTGNYNDTSGTVADQIDKAPSSTVVTCLAGPFVYSGSAHTPCSAAVTGAGGLSETLTVSYTDNVDAGTATASAGYAGDDNHEASSDSETFTIDKAPSSTVVTCLAGPFVYSGSAHTPCSAAVTGAGGLSETLTVSYTDNVDAGTATASAGYAGDDNHEASSDSETFTIDKAPSSTVVTFEAGPYIYRGTSFAATALATGVGGLSIAVAVDYSGDCTNVTIAGGCTASATFAGDLNHYGSGDSKSITILRKNVTGAFTAANKVWDGTTAASVVTTTVVGALVGDDVELTGGTATFASSTVGTWTVTLTGAGLMGSDAGNYNLTSVETTTATITTAFRIIGFDSPVDMTVVGNPRIYNSVKNGQTVPLKFRVFNLNGTEVTSTTGLSAWARNVGCASGIVEPDLIPVASTADTGLRRTGDRFHFNWAVPKGALKCYQVLIQTVDGSTTMVGSLSGTPVQEAWFKSK